MIGASIEDGRASSDVGPSLGGGWSRLPTRVRGTSPDRRLRSLTVAVTLQGGVHNRRRALKGVGQGAIETRLGGSDDGNGNRAVPEGGQKVGAIDDEVVLARARISVPVYLAKRTRSPTPP